MEGRQFDELTKRLGENVSRRQVLKGVGASLLSVAGVVGGNARVTAHGNDDKDRLKDHYKDKKRHLKDHYKGKKEPGGTSCGRTWCAEGQVCCNPSCGICTEPGGFCIQQYCG